MGKDGEGGKKGSESEVGKQRRREGKVSLCLEKEESRLEDSGADRGGGAACHSK